MGAAKQSPKPKVEFLGFFYINTWNRTDVQRCIAFCGLQLESPTASTYSPAVFSTGGFQVTEEDLKELYDAIGMYPHGSLFVEVVLCPFRHTPQYAVKKISIPLSPGWPYRKFCITKRCLAFDV